MNKNFSAFLSHLHGENKTCGNKSDTKYCFILLMTHCSCFVYLFIFCKELYKNSLKVSAFHVEIFFFTRQWYLASFVSNVARVKTHGIQTLYFRVVI